jgi:molecular chaperone Hsp33
MQITSLISSKDVFPWKYLSTIGKQELQSMIDEDHGCEITCQFCNTKYQFSEEELQNLINRL